MVVWTAQTEKEGTFLNGPPRHAEGHGVLNRSGTPLGVIPSPTSEKAVPTSEAKDLDELRLQD